MDDRDAPPPGSPAFPGHQAAACRTVDELDLAVTDCHACPRLVEWREQVAHTRRAAFKDERYWGRPVPGFGPSDARLAVVGLAPAAHGGNRTGRMFTGDPSGDFLMAALYEVGLASQPTSVAADDGLRLYGVRLSSPVHCAPPDNRPTPQERDTCRPWLARELELLRPTLRTVVVLGGFGWQALLPVLAAAGWRLPRPRPAFGHGVRFTAYDPVDGRELTVLGCYHPSQRNTSTKRVTLPMLVDVLRHAAGPAGLAGPRPDGKG
ncbi:uracil-DNA glycosylase [Streptomyces sp. YC504]|uniref:Type-5 uracil-DNA glycosylase n=1 Tax=Streptomyces mesophilus TaxID=1775132 RepID=A0A6G4XF62_9ACTN|nr:uracil-DNA glycosylase [Streptomyces mesophilus]NGO75873.1 uracil-DNA glycosylase [Streptomyces mesophilus]